MSRYCGNKEVRPILDAANYWRDHCFLNGKSIFTESNIWTSENVDQLIRFFVNNLDILALKPTRSSGSLLYGLAKIQPSRLKYGSTLKFIFTEMRYTTKFFGSKSFAQS